MTAVCSLLNRRGTLCSKCKEGMYSPLLLIHTPWLARVVYPKETTGSSISQSPCFLLHSSMELSWSSR